MSLAQRPLAPQGKGEPPSGLAQERPKHPAPAHLQQVVTVAATE